MDPVWYGPAPGTPPSNRFDAPGGEYRICYFGDSPDVAFAETLIRRTHTRLVMQSELDVRSASNVAAVREIRLARFHGPGLVRIGVGAEVAHGEPYDLCQALALEIWQHAAAVDGIQYRSRWDNDRLCVALFDRARDALSAPASTTSLTDSVLLTPILRRYDIGIA